MNIGYSRKGTKLKEINTIEILSLRIVNFINSMIRDRFHVKEDIVTRIEKGILR